MVSSIPLVLNYDNDGNIQGLKQATEIAVGSITATDFSVEGTFLPLSISATTISAVNLSVDNINLDITALADVDDNLFTGGDGKYLFITGGSIIASSVVATGANSLSALDDVNITSPVAGQVLTWQPGGWEPSTSPAGVTNHSLLTNLNANDHCFSEDTELLTKRGFINYKYIQENEEALTLNLDTDILEYQKILGKYVYNSFDKLISLENKYGEILVTPKHSIIYKNTCKEEKRKSSKWLTCTAEETLTKSVVEIPVGGNPTYVSSTESKDFFTLLGIIISEGNFCNPKLSGYGIRIYQKYKNSSFIRELLEKLKVPFTESFSKKEEMSIFYIRSAWAKENIRTWISKKDISEQLMNIRGPEFFAFLKGMIFGDGSVRPRNDFNKKQSLAWLDKQELHPQISYSYYSGDKDLIDNLSQLCILNGLTCYSANRVCGFSTKPVWTLNIKSRLSCLFSKGTKSIVPYSGDVWCVSVPNKTVVLRRNGFIFIAGNTQYTLSATNAALSSLTNSHIGDATIHFTEASINHTNLANLGANTHPQYTLSATNAALSSLTNSHIGDATIHFTEASINHTNLQNLGANTHPQYTLSATNAALSSLVNSHVGDATIHFTEGSINHNALANLTAGDVHTQYFRTDGTRAATGNFSTRDITAQGTRQYNTSAWNIVEASTVSATVFKINTGGFAGIDSNNENVLDSFAKLKFVDLTGTPNSGENSIYVQSYEGGGSVVADSVHFHRDDGTTSILALIDADTTGVVSVEPTLSTGSVFSTWNKSTIYNTFLNKSQNSTVSGDVTVTGNLIVSGTSTLSGNVATSGNINMVAGRTVDGRDVSVDGAALDAHIASSTVHFTEASINHTNLQNLGANTHPQYVLSATNATLSSTVSTHIADSTIHFTATSIDHNTLQNLTTGDVHTQYVLATGARNITGSQIVSGTLTASAGVNTSGNINMVALRTVDGRDISVDGAALDAHIASSTVHFTEASINHNNLTNLTTGDVHTQYVLATGARNITGAQIVSGLLTASGGVNTSGNVNVVGNLNVTGNEILSGSLTVSTHANVSGDINLSGQVNGKLGRTTTYGHPWYPVFARNTAGALASIHLQINFQGTRGLSQGIPAPMVTSGVIITCAQNTYTSAAPPPAFTMRAELYERTKAFQNSPPAASGVSGVLVASAGPFQGGLYYSATGIPITQYLTWNSITTGLPIEVSLGYLSNIYMFVESTTAIDCFLNVTPILYNTT